MAFHDVRLPDDIERGAVGGPGFKTTVTVLGSGHEQRNIDWSKVRESYDVGYGLLDQEDAALDTTLDILQNFFFTRQGRAHGFRFKDWSDFKIGDFDNPTLDNQSIGTGDNIKVAFQVFKRYSSGGINYDRTINKLVSGKVTVLLDGVLKTGGGADYTADLTTGIITFTAAPGIGVDIQIAVEFDIPVRFDIDQMNLNMEVLEVGSWPNIPLVGLRL